MTLGEMVAEREEKIRVEIFLVPRDHTPVEELVTALGNSERWRNRLEVEVTRAEGWPLAQTPYGTFRGNFVVVDGTHVVHGTDYWALSQALEDTAQPMTI